MNKGTKTLIAASVAALIPVVALADAPPDWLLRKRHPAQGPASAPPVRHAVASAPAYIEAQHYGAPVHRRIARPMFVAPLYGRSFVHRVRYAPPPMQFVHREVVRRRPIRQAYAGDPDAIERTSEHIYEGGLATPGPVYAGAADAQPTYVQPAYVQPAYVQPSYVLRTYAVPISYAAYPLPTTSSVIYNRPALGSGWPAQAGYAYFADGRYVGGTYPAAYYPHGWSGVSGGYRGNCGCD